MSRTKRFLGGLSLGYTNQALLTLAGLWLTPFLLHRIGQQDYGLWLVATQLLSWLMLADLGVVALLPRETAYSTGRAGGYEKARDLPEIVGQTIRLTLLQVPLVALAAVVLWFLIPAEWTALRWPLGLVMAVFVLLFPCRIFTAVLQGLQDLSFLALTQMSIWLLSTALTIAMVFAGFKLYALVFGWLVTQLLAPIVLCLRLLLRFPKALPSRLTRLHWPSARTYLVKGFWINIAQIAQTILNGIDILIIGKVLGPAMVVPYACTGKLINVMANQPQMLMQAAFPALSEMRTAESKERLFRVCTALSQAMLVISGCVVCVVLAVNKGFVSWWVGPEQYWGYRLTMALLLTMMLRHWSTTSVYALLCFGYERRVSVTHLIDGLVTLTTSAILIWLLGPIGGPLGSMIGVCSISLPRNLSALARELNTSRAALIAPLWPWFWRFAGFSLM
ncbi:MAG: oligosaccharide flippase family protein, partial [Blastocatellia bacterium]